jgi:hypothetical protein
MHVACLVGPAQNAAWQQHQARHHPQAGVTSHHQRSVPCQLLVAPPYNTAVAIAVCSTGQLQLSSNTYRQVLCVCEHMHNIGFGVQGVGYCQWTKDEGFARWPSTIELLLMNTMSKAHSVEDICYPPVPTTHFLIWYNATAAHQAAAT